jgi:hypothetical protein
MRQDAIEQRQCTSWSLLSLGFRKGGAICAEVRESSAGDCCAADMGLKIKCAILPSASRNRPTISPIGSIRRAQPQNCGSAVGVLPICLQINADLAIKRVALVCNGLR